jgi:hypothetical protein
MRVGNVDEIMHVGMNGMNIAPAAGFGGGDVIVARGAWRCFEEELVNCAVGYGVDLDGQNIQAVAGQADAQRGEAAWVVAHCRAHAPQVPFLSCPLAAAEGLGRWTGRSGRAREMGAAVCIGCNTALSSNGAPKLISMTGPSGRWASVLANRSARATARNSAPSSTSWRYQPGEPLRLLDRLSFDLRGLTMAPSLIDRHIQAVTSQLKVARCDRRLGRTRSCDHTMFAADAQTGFPQPDPAVDRRWARLDHPPRRTYEAQHPGSWPGHGQQVIPDLLPQ